MPRANQVRSYITWEKFLNSFLVVTTAAAQWTLLELQARNPHTHTRHNNYSCAHLSPPLLFWSVQFTIEEAKYTYLSTYLTSRISWDFFSSSSSCKKMKTVYICLPLHVRSHYFWPCYSGLFIWKEGVTMVRVMW